jgi:hypothetical protein
MTMSWPRTILVAILALGSLGLGSLGLGALGSGVVQPAAAQTSAPAATAPAATAPAATAPIPSDGVHLGVASCAGNNCHGSIEPYKTSRVAQNEYLIWVQKDRHSKAFAVLREDRSKRIAANLGLPDAEHA